MSDPCRPPSHFLTARQTALARAPDAFVIKSGDFVAGLRKYKNVDGVKEALAPLNVGRAHSVELDRELLASEPMRSLGAEKLARTTPGPGQPRTRSAQGKEFAARAYDLLPRSSQVVTLDEMGEVLSRAIRVLNPGTVMAIGRIMKYYPKKGRPTYNVTSQAKAKHMMKVLGMNLEGVPPVVIAPFPLVHDGQHGVKVSSHSSNGLPTLGNSDDPDDLERCRGLAVAMEKELMSAYAAGGKEGVRAWVRHGQETKPHMWTLMGRCKGEVTTTEKYDTFSMRYYTAWPRWLNLLNQRVTQPFEQLCGSVFTDPMCHNAQGISLAHGGGSRLVHALEAQLEATGFAYVVCGDDTWIVIWDGTRLHMFALDGSSYDLTLVSEVMAPYQDELHHVLARFSPAHAALWWATTTYRKVVMMGAVAKTTKDTNPSGGTLVSKLNSLCMGDGVEELRTNLMGLALTAPLSEEVVREEVLKMAKRRGWTLKLEQYTSHATNLLSEALLEQPFLFLGYWFHRRGVATNAIQTCLDPRRWMASAPAPPGLQVKGEEFQVLEAMRLGGIAINLGVPPVELHPAFEAARAYAVELLGQLRSDGRFSGWLDKDLGRWDESPTVGVAPPATITGVYSALLQPAYTLWTQPPPPPLPPTDSEEPDELPKGWGEEMAEDEADTLAHMGWVAPTPEREPRARRSAKVSVSDRPATAANEGRPPPQKKIPPPRASSAKAPRAARGKPIGAGLAYAYDDELDQEDSDVQYDESESEGSVLSDRDYAPRFEEVDEDAQGDLFNKGVIESRVAARQARAHSG